MALHVTLLRRKLSLVAHSPRLLDPDCKIMFCSQLLAGGRLKRVKTLVPQRFKNALRLDKTVE